MKYFPPQPVYASSAENHEKNKNLKNFPNKINPANFLNSDIDFLFSARLLLRKIFDKEAFQVNDNRVLSILNEHHFLLQFSMTLKHYGSLLNFLDHGEIPCEECIKKIITILWRKFGLLEHFSQKSDLKIALLQNDFEKMHKMSIEIFCDFCYKKTRKMNRRNFQTELAKQNSERIRVLLNKSQVRKEIFYSSQTNLNVKNQIDIQRKYLGSSLVILEKKIFSDIIFRINFEQKNGLVQLSFAKHGFNCSINKQQLMELDKWRENSLFKIGRVGFKCFNSLFSYNVRLLAD